MEKTVKYLKDYTKPSHKIRHTSLTFIINEDNTVQVQNIARYTKNSNLNQLVLSGHAELISIAIDNHVLSAEQFKLQDNTLTIFETPDEFSLTIITLIKPFENKTGAGMYASNGNLITQCEPHGFSLITYYLDRPDVQATFTTTIICKNNQYNTILSNGNKILEEINGELKIVKWHDPFPKPSYLFAVVVGNLEMIEDFYITKSNRRITLQIFSEPNVIHRTTHAMESLKRAIKWDETRFNLEYDLDVYMIVATSEFNMGAMENKGLNIFNTKYILADKETATDTDFILAEAVIGHEYFHNWTGNRVTCRDWFQLSLKEGLTVFRDQEFTADLHDRTLKRIQEVKNLRNTQFPQDSGPLAHSVRPDSYIDMNNFYTVTVYDKGAEIVRMYQTILGNDGFNKGFKEYINSFDGSAATCDDFCQSMSKANNIDLSQFMLWYSQAGTPIIDVIANYNQSTGEYSLSFTQTIPDTPNQTNKKPMLIPIAVGLIDSSGHEIINLNITGGEYINNGRNIVLLLKNKQDVYKFNGIKSQPVASLLRDFSAPVKLNFNLNDTERCHLIKYDTDFFNRYENLQHIIQQQIINIYHKLQKGTTNNTVDTTLFDMLKIIINDTNISPALCAIMVQLPTFSEMLVQLKDVEPRRLTNAIKIVGQQIGEQLFDNWIEIYNINLDLSKQYDFNNFGKRSLKNIALHYIVMALENKTEHNNSLQLIETLTLGQFNNAQNMTDSYAVLVATANLKAEIRKSILDAFYTKWCNNELVIDKWFAIQAMSSLITIKDMNKLMVDKAFIATNPNKIYALLRTFTQNSLVFHNDDGYSFILDKIIAIDKFNPHVASILTQGFNQSVYLSSEYKQLAKNYLNKLVELDNISDAVYEIASKILIGLKG